MIITHFHGPYWCEFPKVADTLCLRPSEVWLPLIIDGDERHMHGFCEYHAGLVIGAIVAAGETESETEP